MLNNVRHERQAQAQLEAVRSMEGLGSGIEGRERIHDLRCHGLCAGTPHRQVQDKRAVALRMHEIRTPGNRVKVSLREDVRGALLKRNREWISVDLKGGGGQDVRMARAVTDRIYVTLQPTSVEMLRQREHLCGRLIDGPKKAAIHPLA
jgi:hypothetical protein